MLHTITNQLAIFRDDVFPFFGGGNKARKMMALHETIVKNNNKAIVTTGGIQSNHCRVVALYCKKNNIKCTLVLHGGKENFDEQGGNAKIIRSTNAKIIFCAAGCISDNMNSEMLRYEQEGLNPYYLKGGGHTLEGGKIYIDMIEELVKANFIPDYIFLASGSGTTQAGILAGVSKHNMDTNVIGISVGRKKEILESEVEIFYNKLCEEYKISKTKNAFKVKDNYLCDGYEKYNTDIRQISENSLIDLGVLLDTTYTGKAFYGMQETINEKSLHNKKVLFWYTGGIYNYLV